MERQSVCPKILHRCQFSRGFLSSTSLMPKAASTLWPTSILNGHSPCAKALWCRLSSNIETCGCLAAAGWPVPAALSGMVLIAPTAEISYWSGASENEAAIELQDWGVAALHTNAALSPEISVTKAAVKLSMFSQQQPPAFISVTAQWLSGWPQLQLQLPFPAGSGRFSRSDGSVLPDKASISLQRIHACRYLTKIPMHPSATNSKCSFRLIATTAKRVAGKVTTQLLRSTSLFA